MSESGYLDLDFMKLDFELDNFKRMLFTKIFSQKLLFNKFCLDLFG